MTTPKPTTRISRAAEAMFADMQAWLEEKAAERGELLDMKAEAESAGRPFYMGEELDELNKAVADGEEQELILTAIASGYMLPVPENKTPSLA